MSELFAIKVPETINEILYKELTTILSPNKRMKLNRFLHKSDAYRGLLGDIFIRNYLWEKFSIRNDRIEYNLTKYGKPVINLGFPFSFNISHSGDWVICIIDDQDVGVDIEKIEKIDLDIAKRFYSPNEYEDLMLQPESQRNRYFFDLWTLKESYIKCIGRGLNYSLNSFTIKIKESEISVIGENRSRDTDWKFRLYDFDLNYSFAACAKSELPEEVVLITSEQLIKNTMKYLHKTTENVHG